MIDNIACQVEKIIDPIVNASNLELVDVEWKSRNGSWVLSIFIDKTGGITITDCEAVHREISDLLDRVDPIPHSYILEVSSPGIERPLKKIEDYNRYANHPVKVLLTDKIGDRKKISGVLRSADNECIIIEAENEEIVTIPFSLIDRTNIRYDPEFHKI